MNLILQEVDRLVDDYYKCEINYLKEQIISDIDFLMEAYLLWKSEDNTTSKS